MFLYLNGKNLRNAEYDYYAVLWYDGTRYEQIQLAFWRRRSFAETCLQSFWSIRASKDEKFNRERSGPLHTRVGPLGLGKARQLNCPDLLPFCFPRLLLSLRNCSRCTCVLNGGGKMPGRVSFLYLYCVFIIYTFLLFFRSIFVSMRYNIITLWAQKTLFK